MSDSIGVVILAAGEGSRLKLDCAKPLAPILDSKLVNFPIIESSKFANKHGLSSNIGIVTGHQREKVEAYILSQNFDANIHFAVQEKQRGTADALSSYFKEISEAKNYTYTLIMCADTPLLTEEVISDLYKEMSLKNYDGIAATFIEDFPTGYGRIIRGDKGFHIVEEKDASSEIRKVTEVNAALYFLKTSFVTEELEKIDDNNKSGEFYLTDIFKDNYNVGALCFEDKSSFLGINTLEQLEIAEKILRSRRMLVLQSEGVRFVDKSNSYVNTTEIGSGSYIYPNVHIDENSVIGKNVVIEAGCIIKNSKIEDNVILKAYSHLEDSILEESCVVGPYARLRPGTVVGEESKIGNFVEIKKAVLEKGVKISHLSYVGDAEIGSETNIGCGFITCNYDGEKKHLTKIGKGCFIGSDSQMVAPVELGDKCFVASGSTITHDMSEGSFAISRSKQVTKAGLAKKFLK